MKTKYSDLAEQVFNLPNEQFEVKNNELYFNSLDLNKLIKENGSPLKVHYLPKISENINRAKKWFKNAIKKHSYQGSYEYCYCTKSSHFSFVLKEALRNNIHIETSSAYDLNIVENLYNSGDLNKNSYVVCNGFKTANYYDKMLELIEKDYNILPVVDSFNEADILLHKVNKPTNVGIRIASEEEPKFEFYTSRLGVGYKDVISLFKNKILPNENLNLKMLHFFINTGIKDTAYYWNELNKCLSVYCELKKIAPKLNSLNIGGGFPISKNLNKKFDYQEMIDLIIEQIKAKCEEENVDTPDIFTEFGSFTVGESACNIFEIVAQKKQNEKEKWNLIDSSFMTNLPDTWSINDRFILLPINHWNKEYERVLLGGLSCDSDDYYNSEQHTNAIFLPEFDKEHPLYIGFFNTGAYQENIGGFGGIQHCLLPNPKHIIVDSYGNTSVFTEQQSPEQMLSLLGY